MVILKKVFVSIFILVCIAETSFAQNQFSAITVLNSAVDIHAGVHAAINPTDDSLEFTAYSTGTNNGLVHISINNGNAVVTQIEANVFAGVTPATGLDTYFVFGPDEKRYVAYYHQVAGVFKIATDASGVWTTQVVDNTGTTGLSPILSVGAGQTIFAAYYRTDTGDLVTITGPLGGGYTRAVLEAVGNADPEVSFVGNPQAGSRELLFRNQNLTTVRHAVFSSNAWNINSLGINGYNPTGSYYDNGNFYVNAAPAAYNGLGAADNGLVYYYKANGGVPNTGINQDSGHSPDYSQNKFASAHALEFRSALFPDHTTIRLAYPTSQGTFSQTLTPAPNCMVDIRNVQVLADSADGVFVVASLGFDSCTAGINSIAYAYRQADPDSGGGNPPDNNDPPSQDDPPSEENPTEASIEITTAKTKKTIEFTLDVVPANDTSCVITARGYKRINKIVATKDLATIDSSQNVNIIAMLKGKKIKFNLDYLLTCGSLNQSIVLPASTITTDSILIKTKGKKKAKGKKAAKAIKKFINKLSVQ